MAKQNGLGVTSFNVDDASSSAQDIVNDITNFEIALSRANDDSTGVDQSSVERLYLLGDASVTLNGKANFATDASHDVLSTVCSADVVRTMAMVISSNTFSFEAVLSGYNISRPQSGAFNWTSGGSLADGTDPAWS